MTPQRIQIRREEDFSFELIQGGIVVAEVTASNEADAMREIMHYAMMYAQDGPCVVRPAALANPSDGEE